MVTKEAGSRPTRQRAGLWRDAYGIRKKGTATSRWLAVRRSLL